MKLQLLLETASNEFYQDIESGKIKSPDLLVVTNNFNGSLGAKDCYGLDNMLPIQDEKYSSAIGITLLSNMILAPSRKMKKKANILISGNGYNCNNNIHHIWSNEELACIANDLSLGISCFSLDIGQSYNVSNEEIGFKYQSLCSFIDETEIIVNDEVYQKYLSNEQIISELNIIARTWMINEYGQAMLSTESYMGAKLGNRRLVFVIEDHFENVEISLDIANSSFQIEEKISKEVMKKYPYGIKTTREILSKLLNGDIQAWEFINICSQWYICSRYRSPFAFLLEYFSESIDQERAYSTYVNSLQEVSFNAETY